MLVKGVETTELHPSTCLFGHWAGAGSSEAALAIVRPELWARSDGQTADYYETWRDWINNNQDFQWSPAVSSVIFRFNDRQPALLTPSPDLILAKAPNNGQLPLTWWRFFPDHMEHSVIYTIKFHFLGTFYLFVLIVSLLFFVKVFLLKSLMYPRVSLPFLYCGGSLCLNELLTLIYNTAEFHGIISKILDTWNDLA